LRGFSLGECLTDNEVCLVAPGMDVEILVNVD